MAKKMDLKLELESRQQHMSAIFFLSHSFLGKVLPKKEWKLVSIISERQDTVYGELDRNSDRNGG